MYCVYSYLFFRLYALVLTSLALSIPSEMNVFSSISHPYGLRSNQLKSVPTKATETVECVT